MPGYYDDKLTGERLKRVYDVAPPRVRQYLDAEVAHVFGRVRAGDAVLELGCGYGRVLRPLAARARRVVGVDTSLSSLAFGREYLGGVANVFLANMNAVRLGFGGDAFDVVVCVQNGVSAFHVDPAALVAEAVRVARPGGKVLFSSYAAAFWDERLDWFERQAAAGLVGEIDREKTGAGVIVCRDGFAATTLSPERFLALAAPLPVAASVVEVDGSSVFCEMVRSAA